MAIESLMRLQLGRDKKQAVLISERTYFHEGITPSSRAGIGDYSYIKWTKSRFEQLKNSGSTEEAKLETRQVLGKEGLQTRVICIADVLGTWWGTHCWIQALWYSPGLLWKTEQTAWPRVGTGSTDNSSPCWFLLLPLCHLPNSAVVCSRAGCSYLSRNPAVWLQRTS